jgi:hypothetical protein
MEVEMEKPTCKTCAYWDEFSPDNKPSHADGVCRRRPSREWCVSDSADWCGEHPKFEEYLKQDNQ